MVKEKEVSMKILKVFLMIRRIFALGKNKSIQGSADGTMLNQVMHPAEFLTRW